MRGKNMEYGIQGSPSGRMGQAPFGIQEIQTTRFLSGKQDSVFEENYGYTISKENNRCARRDGAGIDCSA